MMILKKHFAGFGTFKADCQKQSFVCFGPRGFIPINLLVPTKLRIHSFRKCLKIGLVAAPFESRYYNLVMKLDDPLTELFATRTLG